MYAAEPTRFDVRRALFNGTGTAGIVALAQSFPVDFGRTATFVLARPFGTVGHAHLSHDGLVVAPFSNTHLVPFVFRPRGIQRAASKQRLEWHTVRCVQSARWGGSRGANSAGVNVHALLLLLV